MGKELFDNEEINGQTFIDYLRNKGLNPFEIALKDIKELKQLKEKWSEVSFDDMEEVDLVYSKLSSYKKKVDNDKLVKVVKRMTKDDTDQTNLVGSWIYHCLNGDKKKADKYKSKVSKKYVNIMTKYINDFITMLGTKNNE